jgi:hypothetical protein
MGLASVMELHSFENRPMGTGRPVGRTFKKPIARSPGFVCPEIINPTSVKSKAGRAGHLIALVNTHRKAVYHLVRFEKRREKHYFPTYTPYNLCPKIPSHNLTHRGWQRPNVWEFLPFLDLLLIVDHLIPIEKVQQLDSTRIFLQQLSQFL